MKHINFFLVIYLSIFALTKLLSNSTQIDVQTTQNVFVVSDSTDGATNSLRNIINNAPSGSTITFSSSLPKTIYLSNYIIINRNIFIDGPGSNRLSISSGGIDIIFSIRSLVTISGLTLKQGYTQISISGIDGGAISNSGKLILDDVIFQSNIAARYGGAIYNSGDLQIENCTFLGNKVLDYSNGLGGAIYNQGKLMIVNSTFYRNIAVQDGSAIYNSKGDLEISYSTIWGNKVSSLHGTGLSIKYGTTILLGNIISNNFNDINSDTNDIAGKFISRGYNIVQIRNKSYGYTKTDLPDYTNPLLDTSNIIFSTFDFYDLENGIVKIIPVMQHSPAVNAIPLFACTVKTDEVGTIRPQGQRCDIGAYELTIPFYF